MFFFLPYGLDSRWKCLLHTSKTHLPYTQVTKRESADGDEEWKEWNWKSEGDEMVNGAFFTPSGKEDSPSYAKFSSMVARPASLLKTTHPSVGVLSCEIDQAC